MSSSLPPASPPIVSHTVPPHGLVSLKVKVVGWLLVGAVVVIVVIAGALMKGSPNTLDERRTQMQRSAAARPLSTPLLQDLPPEPPVKALPPDPTPTAPPSSSGRGAATGGQDARAQKRYQSLFAKTLLLSRERTAAPDGRREGSPSPEAIATAAYEAAAQSFRPPGPERAGATPATPAPSKRTPPLDDAGDTHTLLEYTFFDAVLSNRINGETDSPVLARVTLPVYSWTRNVVVIPPDTRILGRTKAVNAQGQSRLAVNFHRLIYPDGSTYSLDDAAHGLEIAGDHGLKGKVNRHYAQMFGAAAAIGLISGFSQAIGSGGYGDGDNRTTIVMGGVGESTAQTANSILHQFTNRLPDIEIREGHRLAVILMSDLDLPEWKGP